MSRRRQLLPAALGVLVLAALATALLAGKGGSHTPSSPVVNVPAEAPQDAVSSQGGFDGAAVPARAPRPFSLIDQYGRAVSLSSLHGSPVVLAFLYAHCGAPCVLIAQQIRGALDELGSHPVPVVIISADPAGDTPPAIRSFLAGVSLSGRAYYLTGPATELAAIWDDYGVHPASAGRAAFANYASVRLLDKRGRERVVFGSEQLTAEGLVHDIGRLRAG